MNLLPLNLNINLDGYAMLKSRERHPAFMALKSRVLARDKKTCRYCGYTGDDTFVVNYNGNYRNNALSNLVTSCPLCAAALFVGSNESQDTHDESVDKLIYLPEVSQAQLSQLLRVIFVRISERGDKAEGAKEMYRSLRMLSRKVDEIFGEDASNVQVFTQLSIDAKVQKHRNYAAFMSKLRIIPAKNKFLRFIPSWNRMVNAK